MFLSQTPATLSRIESLVAEYYFNIAFYNWSYYFMVWVCLSTRYIHVSHAATIAKNGQAFCNGNELNYLGAIKHLGCCFQVNNDAFVSTP